MTDQYEPCNAQPPREGIEPCPLQNGHDGGHLAWWQADWRNGTGVWGVVVVDEEGKTLWNLEVQGKSTQEEIGCMIEYLEAVRRKR